MFWVLFITIASAMITEALVDLFFRDVAVADRANLCEDAWGYLQGHAKTCFLSGAGKCIYNPSEMQAERA
jgi:hypothetical protein